MRTIWTPDEVKSSEIANRLSERMSWMESVIKTLVRRLVNKDLAETRKKGQTCIYSAMVSENEMMCQVAKDIFAHTCDMYRGGLLARLIKEIPLSKPTVDEIQAEFSQMKQSAPESVPYDCLHNNQRRYC